MNKKEKLIVVGCSCSGKDHLKKELIKKGMVSLPKWTTRPKRNNEIQGIDYNFVTEEEFNNAIKNNLFLEWESYFIESEKDNKRKEVFYGTTLEDFNNGQVFIMTPSTISNLLPEIRKECFIVYLNIDKETRLERLKNRKDTNDKSIRRIEKDESDFKNFTDHDLSIKDPNFEISDITGLWF